MLCSKFEKKIFAAIDDSYVLESDSRTKKHLEECPDCKALYKELLLENEYLTDAGAAFTLPSGLNERIINRLESATAPVYAKPYRKLGLAMAAAAVIVLIVLVYPQPYVAEVADLEGRLQVKKLTGWKDLEEGSSIRAKSVLRTLEDSEAKIVFKEGNFIRFEPDSSMYLGAHVHKQYDHIYRLEYGSIWATISQNFDGDFYIETPNALVIRVIGTEFNVRATPASN